MNVRVEEDDDEDEEEDEGDEGKPEMELINRIKSECISLRAEILRLVEKGKDLKDESLLDSSAGPEKSDSRRTKRWRSYLNSEEGT